MWQVPAATCDLTVYVWDADLGTVSLLAPDAYVQAMSGISADGSYLAFLGLSDTHPAPGVDAQGYAGYVFDRTSGVSLLLSKPHVHVHFEAWSRAVTSSSPTPGAATPTTTPDRRLLRLGHLLPPRP